MREFYNRTDGGAIALATWRRQVGEAPGQRARARSILQDTNCGYYLLGGVADDVATDFS